MEHFPSCFLCFDYDERPCFDPKSLKSSVLNSTFFFSFSFCHKGTNIWHTIFKWRVTEWPSNNLGKLERKFFICIIIYVKNNKKNVLIFFFVSSSGEVGWKDRSVSDNSFFTLEHHSCMCNRIQTEIVIVSNIIVTHDWISFFFFFFWLEVKFLIVCRNLLRNTLVSDQLFRWYLLKNGNMKYVFVNFN